MSDEEDKQILEELKKEREETIRVTLRNFFRMTALNLTTDEGVSLSIDQGLHINRQALVGEIMIEIGKELNQDASKVYRRKSSSKRK
jgi:hypothetical protein